MCLLPDLVQAQTPLPALDQDSIEYYLNLVKEGERQTGRALSRIGSLYQQAGRYNSALTYYDQAIPLLNGEGRSIEVASIYQSKGEIYQIFGDNDEPAIYYRLARIAFLRASEILELNGTLSQRMTINQNLADIATKRKNFNRAVIYQNQVIRALTQLYTDSLQKQADSFNELLNQEIQSSKDTIYLERPGSPAGADTSVPLADWRHLLILILAIALIVITAAWVNQRRTVKELEEQVRHLRSTTQQLQQQKEEIQTLNISLAKTEKEQRRSNLTKDKLFSIISHDLRSPINTMTGFLNILQAKLSSVGDIELRDLAKEMTQATDRLSHFLDDLLKWSMSQLGQIKPVVEKIDIKKLIEENYLLVKQRLKAKNIKFKASIPEDIEVYADPNMVRLILRNLISNAIKFTRNGGYILVSLKPGGAGTSLLRVSDDGIGMSEEKLQEIFDFRGSEINGGSTKQGAGLGLLLCKEFAELNGGDIEVKSKLGEGSVFTVSLPNRPDRNQVQ